MSSWLYPNLPKACDYVVFCLKTFCNAGSKIIVQHLEKSEWKMIRTPKKTSSHISIKQNSRHGATVLFNTFSLCSIRIVYVINYREMAFLQFLFQNVTTDHINSLLINNHHNVFTIPKSQKPNGTALIFDHWLMRIINNFFTPRLAHF